MKEQMTGTDSNATDPTALASSPAEDAGGRLDGMGAADLSRRRPKEPVLWKDGRTPNPLSICTAKRTNGEPCRKTAIRGSAGPVCATHGGSAPQVKRNARIRIERAADRMAEELLGIAADVSMPPAVRLGAIRDALDRGGVSAKTSVEVEVGPTPAWREVFDAAMGGGSRAESRARRGIADDGNAVLDAEVVGADMFDGAGYGSAAATPKAQPPQPSLDTAEPNVSGSTGTGSGTNLHDNAQSPSSEMRASCVGSKIISLEVAHPDDEPPRRIRTDERNRAITPKMTNARKKRRSE